MTAPAKNRRTRRQPRRAVLTFVVVGVMVALLVPAGYLFTKLWSTTGDAARSVTTERAGVGYARPLTKLLSTLLDAQATAVGDGTVDDTGIRGAVDEVNGADRQFGDPLGVRQRWAQLSHEIDTVLSRKPTGADAVSGYGTPVGLTQALLAKISDDIEGSPDFGPGGAHLVETALQYIPEVTVNAGQLAALAHVVDFTTTASSTRSRTPTLDPRLTVTLDRATQAADEVNTGLRTGGDPASGFPVDLNMLGPLDEFSAAIDALTQTANGLGTPGSGARNQLDAVDDRVQKAALTLETAVLGAFDSQLSTRAADNNGQRRELVLAGVIIAVAAAALLWLRVPGQSAGVPEAPEEVAPPPTPRLDERRAPAPTPAPQRIPDVVDARDLLTPELVHVGRGVRARKRRDADDPR
jgi:hypothetical protein